MPVRLAPLKLVPLRLGREESEESHESDRWRATPGSRTRCEIHRGRREKGKPWYETFAAYP